MNALILLLLLAFASSCDDSSSLADETLLYGDYEAVYFAATQKLQFRLTLREESRRGEPYTHPDMQVSVLDPEFRLSDSAAPLLEQDGTFHLTSAQTKLSPYYMFAWTAENGDLITNQVPMARMVGIDTAKLEQVVTRHQAMRIELLGDPKGAQERFLVFFTTSSDSGKRRRDLLQAEVITGRAVEISSKQLRSLPLGKLDLIAQRIRYAVPEHGHQEIGGLITSKYISKPITIELRKTVAK